MSKLALELIAEAKRTNAKKLDLGMCGLRECPDELFELTDLEELYLCNQYWDIIKGKWIKSENNGPANHLSSIPKKINQLKLLRVFHCNGDDEYGNWSISDFSYLKDLSQLQSINLRSNKISDISFLKELTQLQTLGLRDNNIIDISYLQDPPTFERLDLDYNKITDISILKDLSQLQTLDLSSNNITDISFLKDLAQLQTLDLSSNNITDISILKDLVQLQTLDLTYNRITDFSFLKDLVQLQTLDLSSNNITDISILKDLSQLQTLDLRSNNITDISFLKDLVQLQTLDLSSNNITDISFLKDLVQLQTLDLSFNKITDISFLEDLVLLQTLDLSSNRITDISFLKDLVQLQILDLTSNDITDISFLKDLVQLQTLDLTFNRITDFSFLKDLSQLQTLDLRSNNITDISFLKDLVQLETLYLNSNNITDISFLKDLVQLQSLDLSYNKITNFSLLKDLVQLEILYLSNNNITDISFLKDLVQLQSLDLSDNNISDFSFLKDLKQLQTLDLRSNNITDIFPILFLINRGMELNLRRRPSRNKTINIAFNPLTSPPIEIVVQGNDAIINYFAELDKQGVDYIYEAKLLIVGEGGVGKTTLARKLINPSALMPKEEETTKGIDIYKMGFRSEDENDYTINIWDFGGQEIYHATHQFFLTKRSLYILVDDTRKDDKNLDNKVFNYWLQTVELFGGNSPLLIVQNEKGDRSKDIDFSGMKKRFSFLQEQHPCNLLDNRGLSSVKKSIQEQVQQLPHIGDPIPKQWLKIRNELSTLSQEKPFIPIADFFEICKNYEIPEEKRALALSDYLHHLGFFLHFQEDPILKQLVILQNAWATEAVYKIIDSELIKSKKGLFCKADAATVWKEDQYAKNHDELLALMVKFELCYEIFDVKEKSYLIPQLLPVSRPENYHWEPESDLQLRYKYAFMPKGLFSRFIVRMHHHLTDRTKAWRSGCVLKREGATAEIIELFGKNEIDIRVKGTDRKEFLTIIDEAFNNIHRPLENLVLTKLIPCNCINCSVLEEPHFYKYKKLKERLSKGKMTIECDTPDYLEVSINDLLYEVFDRKRSDSEEMLDRMQYDLAEIKAATRRTEVIVKETKNLFQIYLDESEERELKTLTTLVDQISNKDQRDDVFLKIQRTLSDLKEQVDQQEKTRLENIEAELNKEPAPKHKLKLALNLLFLKYEVEYDAIKTLRKIKEDFKNGNWFLKD